MLCDADLLQLARVNQAWSADIRAASAATKALYRPHLNQASNDDVEVIRDLAYGAHERQRLDVLRPRARSVAGPLPVLAFVHGGAFVRGDKSGPDGLYDNVLYWFAKRGFVGVNIEYRLAPQARFPSGAQDVCAALDWVRAHIQRYDGNATRCVLMGHSAGGTHVSDYFFRVRSAQGGLQPAAVVLVSARLRADVSPRNPNREGVSAYYGSTAGALDEQSAVTAVGPSDVPVMILFAGAENPLLDVYALDYAHRLAQFNGHAPRVVQATGHNHMSIVAHLNTGDDSVGDDVLAFLRDHAVIS